MLRHVITLLISVAYLVSPVLSPAQVDFPSTERLLALLRNSSKPPINREGLTEQIAEEMMGLSDSTNRPRKTSVATFARSLTSALSRRSPSDATLSQLTIPIVAVLRSNGVGTSVLRTSLADFERVLVSIKVNRESVQESVSSLEAVSREVRGPEDVPVLSPK